ncbi:CHAP domain-containing protein [Pseudonocardiaceae bacterium YIM PH 21723]|nr:CHAP domain-containing protein [Pseudonocardiaceae bacterium YIM PH 21723]
MSRRSLRAALGTALAAAVFAPLATFAFAATAHAATGQDIANLANANLGKTACGTNSKGGQGFYTSCSGGPEAWCADFAKWVWAQNGIPVNGLTPAASSFYQYGRNNGTLHTSASYTANVGDAVVYQIDSNGSWAQHVGLVTKVNGNGSIEVTNGNYGNSPASSSVQISRSAGRASVGSYIAGQQISAFVNPVGLSSGGDGGEIPAPTQYRIGVQAGGKLTVKEGNLWESWVEQYGGNVAKSQVGGNRIGVLTNDGTLIVKEGSLYASWVVEADNVKDFRVTGNRIAILRKDGTLAVKEGGLSAGWVEQTSDVKDIELSGNWIGVVWNNGTASVKDGNLYSPWINQLGGAADIEIDAAAGRLGVLRTDGSLTVKENGLYGSWVEETSNVKQFGLAGTRIAVLFSGGNVSLKEGDLYAGWIDQIGYAKEIKVNANRLGVVQTDGTLRVKEGNPYANWVEEAAADTHSLASF